MTSKMKRHGFTPVIESILSAEFGSDAPEVLQSSPLLGYLNHKTASASRGSKSRGSFANHYALYVLLEDYLQNGYGPGGKNEGKYEDYAGARFTNLFARQRQLFQVTETIDVKKCFLDIDKIQRFPLTFVVKSMEDPTRILSGIRTQAKERYKINKVVCSYMDAIEEIINIPILLENLDQVVAAGKINKVMEEVILQSKVEFNYNG